LAGRRKVTQPVEAEPAASAPPAKTRAAAAPSQPPPIAAPPPPKRPADLPVRNGLDATWDRRLSRGLVAPDFTIDLHGHSLDAAWSRLEHGLMLAESQGARMVLVITGRPRPVDRGAGHGQRGVIRAKLLDWLAAGSHASRIAAVRGAHPRHGGAGAVYVILRRRG
jgi:DNA-nicking Smr family endonuclease